MAIIEVDNLTKEFQLGQFRSLKETLFGTASRLAGRRVEGIKRFNALSNVSFSVQPGEVLGVIGENGAGKSTLLKLLAGISRPTSGSIRVDGRVAPLIEVGAGLIGDLTGRENIYLNGSILGLSRETIRKKFDEIVDFAELEEFIDTPVKRYSSGMQVRLGFSIATVVEAEILIVDEVLAVGDLAFQRKCFDRMETMIKRQGRTVLFVSHNLRQVERICSRVMILDHGTVVADGPPVDVCNHFFERSDQKITQQRAASAVRGRYESSGEVELLDIAVLDGRGERTEAVPYLNDMRVSILYRTHVPMEKPVFGVGIHSTDFVYLATNQSIERIREEMVQPGTYRVDCTFRSLPLLPGSYALRAGIAVGEMFSMVFYGESLYTFQVVDRAVNRAFGVNEGFLAIEADWSLSNADKAPESAVA